MQSKTRTIPRLFTKISSVRSEFGMVRVNKKPMKNPDIELNLKQKFESSGNEALKKSIAKKAKIIEKQKTIKK